MMKITPYKIPSQPIASEGKRPSSPTFLAFPSFLLTADTMHTDKFEQTQFAPQWLKDVTILKAVNYLNDLEFDANDIKIVQAQGAILPFLSGKEAVNFITNSNIRIKFDTLSSPHIHAQYDFENNFIRINELYKNTQDPAEILAISGAILHEAGHAKDKDGISSVQEEINCLASNALAHRAFVKKYPDNFTNTDSLIVKDGVCVYADLFFDQDPLKTGLISRIKQKYGFLPAGDLNHSPSNLALGVKSI